MLVLCSNGLSSEKILAYTKDKVCTCKTATLVVTADNEYKENNYHVPRCISELKLLNLTVDIFDLDKQPADSSFGAKNISCVFERRLAFLFCKTRFANRKIYTL